MNAQKVDHCPVCDNASLQSYALKDSYNFDRCASCQFVFLNPMPDQATLNQLYTDSDNEAEPTYDKAASRLRRAWIKLPRFFPYAIRKDCLDLGCGGGFIAEVLGRIARHSTGIDISQNAIDYASKRFSRPEFSCQSFEQLLQHKKQYDFVYSSEVIEHVSDINLYMQVITTLTKPGGHVYITTPDIGHARVPADINCWDVFTPPVHVQFFNRASATRLFENYGFEIQRFYRNRKPGLVFRARRLTS